MMDRAMIVSEYAKAARGAVYDYVRAVATGQIPPRHPEEYEWHAVLDSEQPSERVKELVWKQYRFEKFGWGIPVDLQDLESLADEQRNEREIQDRLWEIDREIEELEDERDELDDQLALLRKAPERRLA